LISVRPAKLQLYAFRVNLHLSRFAAKTPKRWAEGPRTDCSAGQRPIIGEPIRPVNGFLPTRAGTGRRNGPRRCLPPMFSSGIPVRTGLRR